MHKYYNEEACPRCRRLDTNIADGGKFRCVACNYPYKAKKKQFGLFGA